MARAVTDPLWFLPRHLIEDVASTARFAGSFDELLCAVADEGTDELELLALTLFAGRHDREALAEPLPVLEV